MSQKDSILAHLKAHGTITPLEALSQYGCFRLADVIFKLRGKGHIIETEMTPQLEGADYATYRYHGGRDE